LQFVLPNRTTAPAAREAGLVQWAITVAIWTVPLGGGNIKETTWPAPPASCRTQSSIPGPSSRLPDYGRCSGRTKAAWLRLGCLVQPHAYPNPAAARRVSLAGSKPHYKTPHGGSARSAHGSTFLPSLSRRTICSAIRQVLLMPMLNRSSSEFQPTGKCRGIANELRSGPASRGTPEGTGH
jgi:hypothetical protein